jgi:hypothetical protein
MGRETRFESLDEHEIGLFYNPDVEAFSVASSSVLVWPSHLLLADEFEQVA